MARHLAITYHALDRFAERHPDLDGVAPAESRRVLMAELERGLPFGGQRGGDELSLLPSGLVAVITWDEGVGVVKTVLTRDYAIAGMQAQGVLPTSFGRRSGPVACRRSTKAHQREPSQLDPLVKDAMRELAEQHVVSGIGKKARNANLRELGYDLGGPAADAYRAFFRTACRAKEVADERARRKRPLRPLLSDRPKVDRGPGLTRAELTDVAVRYTAAWCSHEAERVAEFFAVDGSRTINWGAPAIGQAAIAAAAEGLIAAFPDLLLIMNDLGVNGPTVYYHWAMIGTNTGAGGTGRRVQVRGCEEWRFDRERRIERAVGYFDQAAYRAQLEGGVGSAA